MNGCDRPREEIAIQTNAFGLNFAFFLNLTSLGTAFPSSRMEEQGTLKKRSVTGRPKKIQSSSMTRLHQLVIKNPLASNKS